MTFRKPEFPFYRRSAGRHTSIVLCFRSSVIRRRRPIKNATNQTGLQVVDANEAEFTPLLGCFGKPSCPVVKRRPFICQFPFVFLRQSVNSGWSMIAFGATVPDEHI
jgi:hypothetical protein